jgi:hypothetical protein
VHETSGSTARMRGVLLPKNTLIALAFQISVPAFTQAVEGALLAMHVGDALAFPLHWYYSFDKANLHLGAFYGGRLDSYSSVAYTVSLPTEITA